METSEPSHKPQMVRPADQTLAEISVDPHQSQKLQHAIRAYAKGGCSV